MDVSFLLRGIVIGFSIAAPVGPIVVFLGSALWWLFLCIGISWFRTKFNLKGFKWVNRIAGTIVMAFGLVALFSLF